VTAFSGTSFTFDLIDQGDDWIELHPNPSTIFDPANPSATITTTLKNTAGVAVPFDQMLPEQGKRYIATITTPGYVFGADFELCFEITYKDVDYVIHYNPAKQLTYTYKY
ncbi:MAG: hypothetical protein WBL80_06740, partial [Erysipelotrichaceae bacterium]